MVSSPKIKEKNYVIECACLLLTQSFRGFITKISKITENNLIIYEFFIYINFVIVIME